jgi:ATP-binding cassette subfamily C protein
VLNQENEGAGTGRIYQIFLFIFGEQDRQYHVMFLGASLSAIFLFKAVAATFVNKVIFGFSGQQGVILRTRLMKNFQTMRYENYLQRNSAEYILAISNFVGQFISSTTVLLRLLSEVIVAIAILSFLAYAHGIVLLFLISLLSITMIGFDKLSKGTVQRSGENANKNENQALQSINEGMRGLKEIRILGKESLFWERVKVYSANAAHSNVRAQTIQSIPRYLLELTLVVFIVVLAIVAAQKGGESTALLSMVAVFGVAALRLMPSANQFSSGITQLRFFRHAVAMIYHDLTVEDHDVGHRGKDASTNKTPFRELQLKKIYYSYPGKEVPAIGKIDFVIRQGEAVGVIGVSGGGKTTLIDVILGLLQPEQGQFIYNGERREALNSEWREQVAYIPQDIFLLDDTIRQNIVLIRDNEQINENRLLTVIQQAKLGGLIDSLPEGLSKLIGENGARLSGGEKQRIALGRALYHRKAVLIMDEATSAIDTETEKEITREIATLKGSMTLIIIAHRHSILRSCDRVYKIDNGRIIEEGTYSEICTQ